MKLRIKEVCSQKGVTLLALSKKIGMAQPVLSRVANGGTKPTLETLERIANGLDVPVSELLEEPKKFIAFVRKGGETFTFEDEYSLKKWLCPGLLPIYTMDQMQEVFKEYEKKESSEERGQ